MKPTSTPTTIPAIAPAPSAPLEGFGVGPTVNKKGNEDIPVLNRSLHNCVFINLVFG